MKGQQTPSRFPKINQFETQFSHLSLSNFQEQKHNPTICKGMLSMINPKPPCENKKIKQSSIYIDEQVNLNRKHIVQRDVHKKKVLVLIQIWQCLKYVHVKDNVNIIKNNVHISILKMIQEGQEHTIKQNYVHIKQNQKNALMVTVVVKLIINMNCYIKKTIIESYFVHNLKIVVLVCIVLMLILKKTQNVT
ncbi:unnamed protein product [Paramecium sonneborni]|uniref:Transmembrane protein n=1 Tax=Paramecium sonneborni TaxID=65129 RepID=A0A8S1PV83_9CILI|nr:unnamed protein product [Paramecium sonneborni]